MSANLDKGNVLNHQNVKSWLGAGTYGIEGDGGVMSADKNESIAVKIARVTLSG